MKTLSGLLVLLLVVCSLAADALAIPAFARKYNMSCTTCHQPFPRLKAYGNEYAGNGFQLPDGEPPRAFRDTGDDLLHLMRELPLAVRLDGYVRWLPQEEGKSDFQTPYVMKLLSGGQITKNVSYYVYFLLSERGEVGGLEDAFVMFNDVVFGDNDFYIGQFQVSDPLFKRELRLPLEDYQIYDVRPGRSKANLTYDRGIMITSGLLESSSFTFQIVNGAGLGAMDASKAFDTDQYKNFALRFSRDFGKQVRFGLYGYLGKEADEATGGLNKLWMLGPDLTLSFGPVELNIQYLERRDENPDLVVSGGTATRTRGGFGELVYLPDGDKSRWYGVLLYNAVDSDYEVVDPEYPSPKYESATAHIGYIVARNFRLIGEYTYDILNKANGLTVGLVAAF
jgi:hypothetical protein